MADDGASELDLHFKTADEATEIVRGTLLKLSTTSSSRAVRFIVGRGSHSKDGPVLRMRLEALFSAWRIRHRYERESATFEVPLPCSKDEIARMREGKLGAPRPNPKIILSSKLDKARKRKESKRKAVKPDDPNTFPSLKDSARYLKQTKETESEYDRAVRASVKEFRELKKEEELLLAAMATCNEKETLNSMDILVSKCIEKGFSKSTVHACIERMFTNNLPYDNLNAV